MTATEDGCCARLGERTLATLERLMSLLSAFEVVVWMTDGWPLYKIHLKGKSCT
ncbi:IS1 family transposase [Shigella flexneri]